MNSDSTIFSNKVDSVRLTQKQKDADDFQYYKDMADNLDRFAIGSNLTISFGVSTYINKKVNYDLFNDIINKNDFAYVCQPFGAETGQLPATFTNRDICSGKIKVLLGMEMKMPFSWKVIAVNEEATTRKEQEQYGRIRDFVVNEVMRPIKTQIEQQTQEQTKGQKLTPEQQQQIQQQIADETQAQTPDEVRRYMTREHQDPAEVMHQQLLRYLILKERVPDKFNKGFKHLNLGAKEVYHIGIFNSEPKLTVVNALRFKHDESPEIDFIEDGDWAVNELRMTPIQVQTNFSEELSNDEIDRIFSYQSSRGGATMLDSDFSFTQEGSETIHTLRVLHCNWKGLQKVGFLIYNDEKTGSQELKLVDENYKLDKGQGDIEIQWEWIPESHEVYKILDNIYVYPRPVPGQNRDLDNLYSCKLSYFGASCDNLNSTATCPMDRMKPYQYYYNVVMYRIELLMASDKGKILVANINSIPKSAEIDTQKFMYFMEANHIAFLNPKEEGNRNSGDVTNMVKEIDMGLASDIMKYINFAEYLEKKCGASIGITPQMEAQIGPNEAVQNTQQNLIQSSHIIQPYFELHNNVKRNVLQGLIETAKVAYSTGKQRKLSYVMDDLSVEMLTVDQDMLDATTIGLFVSNSTKADEAKRAIIGLAQAAMQNQQADLLDIVKIIKSDDVNEAEELLEVSQQKQQEQAQANDKAKIQAQKDAEMKQDTLTRDGWDHEAKMIVLKEEERRKTELQKQAILSTGFDTNKDEDNDGVPDVIELYKHGLNVDIKTRQMDQNDRKLNLEEDKFSHQQKNDKIKNTLEQKKLDKPASK